MKLLNDTHPADLTPQNCVLRESRSGRSAGVQNLNKLIYIIAIIIFLIAIATLCTISAPSVPQGAVADAADFGAVTVTYDGEEYVCSDGEFSSASLQSVIDYAESAYSQINYVFVGLTVRERLTFKKNSLLQTQGTLNFVLNSNAYAMTVNSKTATLTLQGFVATSNRGLINVNSGKLIINSANITVAGCTVSQSAINVYGEAVINGGEIVYSNDNGAFGYGVSVNGGALTVTAETAVKIEGYSALCTTSGKAELGGGEYKANRPTDDTAGYSVDVWEGNLTINDGTFAYPIYDRAVASSKISINGGSVSSVRVTPDQNKKINIGDLQVFAGNYCELNINGIDFVSNTLELSGKKSLTGGFRIAGFTVDGTAVNEPVLTVATDEESTVKPIESNLYKVSLSCDGTVYDTLSYAYGTTVKLGELPAPEKTGYAHTGWQEKKSDFTLNADITLNAVTVLADTDIQISGTELTYDGSEQTITPVLTHALPVTYTAVWEKFESSDWEKVSDGTDLKVTAVADEGTYRITVVATAENGTDTSRTQKEVEITINKGTYTGITHPEFSGVYDPSKTLGAYTLNDDFAWVDVTTVPKVPTKLYPAIYNADPDNYNDLEVSIKIDLAKAAAVSAPPHDEIRGVYEHKQLKDYNDYLKAGFHWQSPEQYPEVKTTSYTALYNPEPDNYENTVRTIVLRLTKGKYENIEHLEDMTMTYRPNYYLSDLNDEIGSEHANYRLIYDGYDQKLNAGTKELTCAYNEDPDNYDYYTFTFALTVNKADIDASDVPEVPSFTGVYGGLPLSEYQLGGYLNWRNPELIPTVDVKTYDAFYNPEPNNYNDFSLKVTITLEKGAYENVSAPTLDAVTYGLTLADISLPEGWSWKNPAAKPTVAVNGYDAEYCLDPTNYLPYAAVIGLTVNKADIPLAVLSDKTVTYDGNAHSLEFENLSPVLEVVEIENNGKVTAGKYEVTATLRQLDTDNYNLHPTTVRGILHIKKAPSVIISPARYDILEGNTVSIEGTVENTEQTLVIPEFNETKFGLYSVTLTTAESTNYLAGERTITISINRTEKYVGNISYPAMYDGTYLYGIIVNTESGIPNDAEISFIPFSTDGYYLGVNISVTVDGGAYDKPFTVKLKMTDGMLSASALKLFAEDGTEVAYTVENGVYMTFETDGNSVFYMQAEFAKKFAWYWIPIGIAIALIAIGAVLVVLWKKGIIKIPQKATANNANAQKASDKKSDTQEAQTNETTVENTQVKETAVESEATATETIKEQNNE